MPMGKYPDAFLADLVRLLQHGPEPLQAVVDDLSDPSTREAVIRKLTTLAEVAKEVTQHKGRRRAAPNRTTDVDQIEEALRTLRSKDPKRHDILVQLRRHLQDKATTLDRKSIRQVGEKLGLHFGEKVPRVQMLNRIVLRLAEGDSVAFDQGLKSVADLDRGSPEEFMRLAGFITGAELQDQAD